MVVSDKVETFTKTKQAVTFAAAAASARAATDARRRRWARSSSTSRCAAHDGGLVYESTLQDNGIKRAFRKLDASIGT